MKRRWIQVMVVLALVGLGVEEARAQTNQVFPGEYIGSPLRIRDFTFPSFLNLGFVPTPTGALGKGNWAVETHYSIINDFQVSAEVEEYLADTRGDTRRGIDAADIDYITSLPDGSAYFIDGEIEYTELVIHRGLTDRLDVSVSVPHIGYSGGRLDGTIFDFHDRYGFGQQGRTNIPDDLFQIVLSLGELNTAALRPPAGGWGDPTVAARYHLGQTESGWGFSLEGGIKLAVADERDFASSGSEDYGVRLGIERLFRKSSFLVNLSVVEPGTYELSGFEPPLLPSIDIAWVKRWGRTLWILQGLVAEHPFRDVVDSDLTELEIQLTFGSKIDTPIGTFGVGLTENIANYDNTPDIGLHFTWGHIFR